MRISDWSSDVFSSDLPGDHGEPAGQAPAGHVAAVGRRAGADGARPAVRRVPHQSGADLRAGRGGRAAGRRPRRPLLLAGRPADQGAPHPLPAPPPPPPAPAPPPPPVPPPPHPPPRPP